MAGEGGKIDPGSGFDPRRWVSNITYEEIHAFQIGAVIFALAAIADSPHILAVGLSILLWALGIRSSPYRKTRDGEKKSQQKKSSGMAKKLLGQIRRETHYYAAGAVAGDRAGWIAYQWLFNTAPDHYEQIPEIVRMLTAGV